MKLLTQAQLRELSPDELEAHIARCDRAVEVERERASKARGKYMDAFYARLNAWNAQAYNEGRR